MADMKADWEAISGYYRAGIRSLRDIAAEFGVTEGAIRKRAKKEEWPRDLSEKIKAKAADLVRKEMVRNGTQGAKEADLVAANANLQASIQLEHRTDIQQKRSLVSKLFDELNEQTENKDLIEDIKTALTKNDVAGLARVAEKLTSLPSRIKGAADLVNAYKSLIGLERQAFGIDDKSSPSDFIESIHITFKKAEHGEENP